MEIERRGVPTVTVVTTKFAAMAREEARYMGADGLPILVIPHPLEGLPREAIEGVVADQIGLLEGALLRRRHAVGPGGVEEMPGDRVSEAVKESKGSRGG